VSTVPLPFSQPEPQPSSADQVTGGRDTPLRVHRQDEQSLVVIVPALNESRTIADVVRRIPREVGGIHQIKVVVVDDGSSDGTGPLAMAEGATVVRHPRPSGVGAAFQSGLRKAFELGADLVVNIDGDGQFNPEDIHKLVAPILSGEADFATASRFKDPALEPEMPRLKRWGNRQVSRLISWLIGAKFADVSCGMRAYNREAALNLSLMEPFTYTHEVFLHLSCKRMKIVEVPIAVRGQREFGKSRVASNLFRYAYQTLRTVFRFYRDHYPMKFFGRIAAICLAVGVPLLTFFLWHYFRTGAFAPHKWAGVSGAAMGGCAMASLFMGLLGDMMNRQRACLEEIRYYTRFLVAADRGKSR